MTGETIKILFELEVPTTAEALLLLSARQKTSRLPQCPKRGLDPMLTAASPIGEDPTPQLGVAAIRFVPLRTEQVRAEYKLGLSIRTAFGASRPSE
jgi:hypothetical protein